MLKKLFYGITAVLICLLAGSGCNYYRNQYIGKTFATQDWPKYIAGEPIFIETDPADFKFVITETGTPGTYTLKGTMDGSRGSLKSINHLVSHKCRFFLLLAKNKVVVSCIPFMPLGLDHTQKLPFSRTFESEPFDAMIIVGKISVQG